MSTVDDIEKIFLGSIPQDIAASDLGKIVSRSIATVLSVVDGVSQGYLAGSKLSTAVDGYLDLHASDRGLRRAANEINDQLRERLRIPPKMVTLEAILQKLQSIIGSFGTVAIVELPLSSMYLDRAGSLPTAPEVEYAMCLDRGRRCSGGRGVVIALIPKTAAAADSVRDALRSSVAAGKLQFVQEYDDTVVSGLIYYPPTRSIMRVAMTPAVDDGVWLGGWLFEEEDGLTEFQTEPEFGTTNKTLSSDTAPDLIRSTGLRSGSKSLSLPDNTTQFVSSNSAAGFASATGKFKFATVVKFTHGTYSTRSVMGYGSTLDSGWFLIHSGAASVSPAPDSVLLLVLDGANTASVELAVPNDQWIVIVGSFDKTNNLVRIAYAGDGVSGSASADASLVTGPISSAISDRFKIGALFGNSGDTEIDAVWYGTGSEITNVLSAAQNLYSYITRS